MALQIRYGTEENWEANKSNIVAGEPVVTTDSERLFVGTANGAFADFANVGLLAEAYDGTTQYLVGQMCVHKGKLYACIKPTTGVWDVTAWSAATLSESVISKADYVELATMMAEMYSATATYFMGQFCIYNSDTYQCIVAITTAEPWNASHWIKLT